MNNSQLLNKRWDTIDTLIVKKYPTLRRHFIKAKEAIIDLYKGIDIEYQDLYKPAPQSVVKRYKAMIEDMENLFFFSSLYSKNIHITYADSIELTIFSIYATMFKKIATIAKQLYKDIAIDSMKKAIDECDATPSVSEITDKMVEDISFVPAINKTFNQYLDILTITMVQEVMASIVIAIQNKRELDIDKLITKQANRIINIKDGKSSGAIVDTSRSVSNQAYILPFVNNEEKIQVMFVADMDEKTTDMCQSLNGQLFYINDYNTFERYSAEDGKDIVVTCYGLVRGLNLPPIDNHFHWCRSTITYQV